MTTPTITASTAYGTFTRQTSHEYTHIVVSINEGTDNNAFSWHGSEKAAQAGLRKAQTYYPNGTFAIVAITAAKPAAPVADEHDSGQHSPRNPFCMKCSADAASEAETASETTSPLGTATDQGLVARGSVLTRAEARQLAGRQDIVLRQVGKRLTHYSKADRKDDSLARTLCGVPINGAGQNWLPMDLVGPADLTCPTCRAASRKQDRAGGTPETTETASAASEPQSAVPASEAVPQAAESTDPSPITTSGQAARKRQLPECPGSWQDDHLRLDGSKNAVCAHCGNTLRTVLYGAHLQRHWLVV